MPAVSLVVCLHQQRDLLERLLQNSAGCYDDLVVVHDGPDTTDVKAVVAAVGGQFFERPQEFQQEPHWPFAWKQAKHDWILRLDADEFPSAEMKAWLQEFRSKPRPAQDISGYTCIWPLWNGQKAVSKKWPDGRIFLFDKQAVRYFGMVEQVMVPDGRYEPLNLILHHQPKRKSYDLHNFLFRKQACQWRAVIAQSLLAKPTDLACWRWESVAWQEDWEQIRQHPFRTALRRLVMGTARGLRSQWRAERRIFPAAAVGGPIYHASLCVKFWRTRRNQKRVALSESGAARK
jgi:hypothetical protein